jgi:hypothetical protein
LSRLLEIGRGKIGSKTAQQRRGAADRGEYRQTAGAVAQAVKREALFN